MKAIPIYADSKAPGTCRSCGAEIEWAELVTSGRRMPFDRPIVVAQTQGSILEGEGRIVEWIDPSVSLSHFATCAQAEAWRQRGKAGTGPRQ